MKGTRIHCPATATKFDFSASGHLQEFGSCPPVRCIVLYTEYTLGGWKLRLPQNEGGVLASALSDVKGKRREVRADGVMTSNRM